MRARILPAAVILVLTAPIFALYTSSLRQYDQTDHIKFALNIIRGRGVQPHPLYHLCLLAFIGGDNPKAAADAAAMLQALATAATAWLTAGFLSNRRRQSPFVLTVVCLALALAMPLPNWWGGDLYLGQITPNVWHNPTCTFAMPFALGLFLIGMKLLETPSLEMASFTSVCMVLSLLAKPHYVMAFAPCLGLGLLTVLWRLVRARSVSGLKGAAILLLTLGPAVAVFLIQTVAITQKTSITISWLAVWDIYSRNIPASIALSLLFPICVLVCYAEAPENPRPLLIAWPTLAIAVLIFATFAESTLKMLEGNFGWGMILANHVLFVASAEMVLSQPASWRKALCLAALGLHAASGAVYLLHVSF